MLDFQRDQKKQEVRLRLVAVFVLVMVCFGLLIARLYWLQVRNHDIYMAKADKNRIAQVAIPPHRGVIFDRNGEILAKNYTAYTLEVYPSEIKNLQDTLDRLGEFIALDATDLAKFDRLRRDARRFEGVPLKTRLTDEEVAKFSANKFRFDGVDIGARLFRTYPFGDSASHVLGHIGRVSERDIKHLEENGLISNYYGTSFIGKEGIEKTYETQLHGQSGTEMVEMTATGRAVRTLSRQAPVTGDNLILSLDIHLQKMAEAALGNRRGALVAIVPQTGEVLAFVSRPGFDPNLFVEGIDVANWKALNESPDKPLMNRPLYSTYPIGSTYKPFIGLAALEYGVRNQVDTMYDPGYFEFAGRNYRNAGMAHYGQLDLRRAIAVSSDTYFYSIGNDLKVDRIHDFMAPFGFGQITGIDLQGERKGILPSIAWKAQAYSSPAQKIWYPGENLNVAVGQGANSFTLLQLAQATAVLANNGIYMKPHVVKTIVSPSLGTNVSVGTTPDHVIELKQENINYIKQAMADVVNQGTARASFYGTPYQAAGKTGTAQVIGIKQNERYVASLVAERHRDHALFMGFAPVDNPQIALALIVENAGWGASVAAPIARKVFDYWLVERPKKEQASLPPPELNPPEVRQ